MKTTGGKKQFFKLLPRAFPHNHFLITRPRGTFYLDDDHDDDTLVRYVWFPHLTSQKKTFSLRECFTNIFVFFSGNKVVLPFFKKKKVGVVLKSKEHLRVRISQAKKAHWGSITQATQLCKRKRKKRIKYGEEGVRPGEISFPPHFPPHHVYIFLQRHYDYTTLPPLPPSSTRKNACICYRKEA